MRLLLASSLGAAVIAAAPIAFAQGPGDAVVVRYRAPAACPREDAFVAQIRARVPQLRRASKDEAATTFDVTIVPSRDRWIGELVARDRSQRSTTRTVTGKPCDDVVDALALVAVLVLEPGADVTAPPPAAAAATTPSSTTSTEAAPAPTPAAPPQAAAAPPPRPPPPAATESKAEPAKIDRDAAPSGPPPRPSRWSAAIEGDALGAGLDAMTPRGAASIRLRALADGFVALGGSFATGSAGTASGASAQASWATITLEGCPVRLRATAAVSLLPCVPVEGGMLSVGASGIANAESTTRAWLSAGAIARLEVALGAWAFLDVHGGARVPLVRDTFYFRPGEDVYRAPLIVGSLGIGAGVHFP